MFPQGRRVERAEVLLQETLVRHPSGLPGIVLVDRLEHWGYPEDEGLALIESLQHAGRLRVERGRFVLAEPDGSD